MDRSTQTPSDEARPETARGAGRAGALAVSILLLVVALPGAVRNAYLDIAECSGPSMEPTLREGDAVVVDRTADGAHSPLDGRVLARWALPEAGDVVVALGPASEGLVVKRVIGLPGDLVEIVDDVVIRNGVPLERRPIDCDWSRTGEVCVEERLGTRRWRTLRSAGAPLETHAPIEVPAGFVYVLGDHRDASYDSRGERVGLVPLERVAGRVRFLLTSAFAGRAPGSVE